MQQRRLINTPENDLAKLRKSLLERFPRKYSLDNAESEVEYKPIIRAAIDRVKYPYSINEYHYYINEETANLLSRSEHPLHKEWGTRCKNFYTSNALQKHVEPATGLVVAERGITTTAPYAAKHPYQIGYYFKGKIIWHIPSNKWYPSPDSEDGTNNHNTLQLAFDSLSPWVEKPKFDQTPFELISPLHVAALIGDKNLMQDLIKKGASLDDDRNHWRMRPLDMAVICEQVKIIDFLCSSNKFVDKKTLALMLNKAFKLAVEKGSFYIIDKFVNDNAPITDEVLDAADARDPKLYLYLQACRKNSLIKLLEADKPIAVLRSMLDSPVISFQSIVDLICAHPQIISDIFFAEENTLPHLLVKNKEVNKVKELMRAIFEASFYPVKDFKFDVEKKNKWGKTILDLALESGEKDIIAAVILYGNPVINDANREKVISTLKINIPGIMQEREKIRTEVAQKSSRMQFVSQEVLISNNQDMIELAAQLDLANQQIRQLTNAVALQQRILFTVCQRFGVDLSGLKIEELPPEAISQPAPQALAATPLPAIAAPVQPGLGLFAASATNQASAQPVLLHRNSSPEAGI